MPRELEQLKNDIKDIAIIVYAKNMAEKELSKNSMKTGNTITQQAADLEIEKCWNAAKQQIEQNKWLDPYDTKYTLYAIYGFIMANNGERFVESVDRKEQLSPECIKQEFNENFLKYIDRDATMSPQDLDRALDENTIELYIPDLQNKTVSEKIEEMNDWKKYYDTTMSTVPNRRRLSSYRSNNNITPGGDDNADTAAVNALNGITFPAASTSFSSDYPIKENTDGNIKKDTLDTAAAMVKQIIKHNYFIPLRGGFDYRCARACTDGFVDHIKDFYKTLKKYNESNTERDKNKNYKEFVKASDKLLMHAAKMHYLCNEYTARKDRESSGSAARKNAIANMGNFAQKIINTVNEEKCRQAAIVEEKEYKQRTGQNVPGHIKEAFIQSQSAATELIRYFERLKAQNSSKAFYNTRIFDGSEMNGIITCMAKMAVYKMAGNSLKSIDNYNDKVRALEDNIGFIKAVTDTYHKRTYNTIPSEEVFLSLNFNSDAPIARAASSALKPDWLEVLNIFSVDNEMRKAREYLIYRTWENDNLYLLKDRLATILAGYEIKQKKNILEKNKEEFDRIKKCILLSDDLNNIINDYTLGNDKKKQPDTLIKIATTDTTGRKLWNDCFKKYHGDKPIETRLIDDYDNRSDNSDNEPTISNIVTVDPDNINAVTVGMDENHNDGVTVAPDKEHIIRSYDTAKLYDDTIRDAQRKLKVIHAFDDNNSMEKLNKTINETQGKIKKRLSTDDSVKTEKYPAQIDLKKEYAKIIAANLLMKDKSEKTEEKISAMADAIYKSDTLKKFLEKFNDKELYNMATSNNGQELFTHYNTAHKDLEDKKHTNSNISISSNKDLNYRNDKSMTIGGM